MIDNPTVYFIITERCNYHCPFCIRNNIVKTDHEVSVDSFRFASSRILERFPDSLLVLTGGESHIHSSFLTIVQEASSSFKCVVITTNGSIPDGLLQSLYPYLRKNVYLQFSLDGPELIHDGIRGDGAYRRCIHCIDSLRPLSNHVIISSTITRSTVNSFSPLAEELNHHAFAYLKISPEQVGNPLSGDSIPSDVWNSFVDQVLPLCHYRVRIQKFFDYSIMDRCLSTLRDTIHSPIMFNCGFGKAKLYITPALDILPCSCVNEIVGNLTVDSLADIVGRLDALGSISPAVDSFCRNCRFLPICNGGCPGVSKKVFGKYNMGDIRCPFLKNAYEKHQSVNNGQLQC